MRTKPKIYLCDTSIGLSCLGVNSKEQLFYDLNTLGIYFENLVVKDLLSFSEVNDAEMYFYRNELGEEIDVIMVMPNGEWAAIEIKLANSYTQNEEHVRKMNKILSQIEPKYGKKKPILKMIVTGHGYSYKIGDTFVIPIQLLDLF